VIGKIIARYAINRQKIKECVISGIFKGLKSSIVLNPCESKMWKKTALKALFLCIKSFYLKKNTLA
jgi:hypothetical protein